MPRASASSARSSRLQAFGISYEAISCNGTKRCLLRGPADSFFWSTGAVLCAGEGCESPAVNALATSGEGGEVLSRLHAKSASRCSSFRVGMNA